MDVDMHSLLHDIKSLALEIEKLKEELEQHRLYITELEYDIDAINEALYENMVSVEEDITDIKNELSIIRTVGQTDFKLKQYGE